jgi:hypothetical protein
MNAYTQKVIETLEYMHRIKASDPVFIRGGKAADELLARTVAYVRANPYRDGDYGGPAHAAMAAIGWASRTDFQP